MIQAPIRPKRPRKDYGREALGMNQMILNKVQARTDAKTKEHLAAKKLIEQGLQAQAQQGASSLLEHRPDEIPSPMDVGLSETAFNQALNKMISASGGKLSIKSGKRSTKRQTELWNAALKKYGSAAKARKWVAPPGSSNHEKGLAADLAYADAAARQWAHQNAKKFGLHFPLGNEPWHIEPVGLRGGGKKAAPKAAPTSHGKWTNNAAWNFLIDKESDGRTNAKNPKSSAFGVGQLIKANRESYGKRLGFHPDTTDFNQQLKMMEIYIKERYGSPEKAAAFHQRNNWY